MFARALALSFDNSSFVTTASVALPSPAGHLLGLFELALDLLSAGLFASADES
jgi:hypothetical protein